MKAKPIKILELREAMIQFLVTGNFPLLHCYNYLPHTSDKPKKHLCTCMYVIFSLTLQFIILHALLYLTGTKTYNISDPSCMGNVCYI